MRDHASDSDLDAIRATAMDYADGWYSGDAERMAQALHPSLVKRTLMKDGEGG